MNNSYYGIMKYEYDCENLVSVNISDQGIEGSLVLLNCDNLKNLYI